MSKQYRVFTKAEDSDEFDAVFIASNEALDSHNTVIPVGNWDLSRYNSNPVVLYQHYGYGGWFEGKPDPDTVIGKGHATVRGDSLMLSVEFDDVSNNEIAEKVKAKVEGGFLNAVSVGFIETSEGRYIDADGEEVKDWRKADHYEFGEVELLEVSVVNIPSNPEALLQQKSHELIEAQKKIKELSGAGVSKKDVQVVALKNTSTTTDKEVNVEYVERKRNVLKRYYESLKIEK